jgi:hypothetical protein
MAYQEYDGLPRSKRAKGYVFPSRERRVLWFSLAVAAVLALGMIGAYFAGVRQTLSPGNVASMHARIDIKCAQCHDEGNEVAAVRCERCHDSSGSDRLTHAAHVLIGTGDARKAEAAGETACATCHVEHRGVSATLKAVDDRECATCHNFSTLARHPEFAAIRAQATAGVGMKFNHDRHLVESQKVTGATCTACHQQTADRAGFVPMTFERHCASCHAPKGIFEDSDPIGQDLVIAPANLPEPWRSATSVQVQPRGRKQIASGLRHRDGWVLYNAMRLRHGIDADGVAAERLALRGQIAYLEQFLGVRPVNQATAEELQAAASQLRSEIEALDARLASTSGSDADAIKEIFESTRVVAKQLGAVQADAPELQEVAQSQLNATPSSQPSSDREAAARFERRKAELLKVLDAVNARTADESLRQRATDLRGQVERLTVPTGGGSSDDNAPLADRLAAIEDVLGVIRGIPDAGVQSQAAQIDVLRAYGQQQVTAAMSPDEFQSRKAELLALLDEIERRGTPTLRIRAAALRQQVIAARPGGSGDADLQRNRKQRQKQLDRVLLQLELMSSHDQDEPPPVQDRAVDPVTLETTLNRLRAQLADVERAPRMPAPEAAEDRDLRRAELDALLSRCLKCHEYDSSGARLAPVKIAEPVMPRSIFNHAPHTTQTSCETCHGAAKTSKLATDIISPGVSNCTTCHAPSKARAECETCHVYHPASPAKLLMAVTR